MVDCGGAVVTVVTATSMVVAAIQTVQLQWFSAMTLACNQCIMLAYSTHPVRCICPQQWRGDLILKTRRQRTYESSGDRADSAFD